jgi:hypothetical protein
MFSMSLQRLIFPTCSFVVGIVLAALVSRFTLAWADQDPPGTNAKSATALLEAAKEVFQGYKKQMEAGQPFKVSDNSEFLYRWSRRWLEAELAVDKAKNKQLAAYVAHLDRMKGLETRRQNELDAGQAGKFEVAVAVFFRIEAEQWLSEAKARQD